MKYKWQQKYEWSKRQNMSRYQTKLLQARKRVRRWLTKSRLACLLAVVLTVQALPGVTGLPRMSARGAESGQMGQGWLSAAASSNQSGTFGMATDSDQSTGSDQSTSSDWELINDLVSEQATPTNLLRSAGVGDLWEDWTGEDDFTGSGTASHPYQIDTLSHLMGLSRAVAAGEDFADTYFELTGDIDLSGIQTNHGNWNPIGWYQNQEELAGAVSHPFRGHFDGGGNRISGLKIIDLSRNLKNIGLFGVIEDGSVRHLTIEAEDIYGYENAAVLAGQLVGAAVIHDVTVSGYVYCQEDAGGIAAEVVGEGAGADSQVTIENCRADGIILNSEGRDAYVGGIAGNVRRAWLVDNVVLTQNGDSNRIQGKGYVGGIAGRMQNSSIYNSYVNGTIGGNGTKAVGGILGKYESGNLMLARMAGDISRTNNGSASREGTFVGTRESRDNFTYGTEKDSRLAYLFTNSAAKAKAVFGSNIDGDNTFTKTAHIGYWTDVERKYMTVAGRTETGCGDRYFYEELEDGVRYIVTQKLGKEFTADGYAKALPFRMDHFAPGYMGEPIRGYMVYIPRIDAHNANGTYDTDVAVLTAMSETGSTYYREIDKDRIGAIAPGAVVTVTTAPKNTNENRYQMVMDKQEPGGVKPPVYRDEDGNDVPMQYVSGGAYSFIMPAGDTVLNAEYIKVTTRLTVDPAETTIGITQTRSGDRKNPGIVTEVKNSEGILIARYIDGVPDQAVEVQPVTVHAEHNGAGQTADRTVIWSVDDTDLLVNASETGYTLKDAAILPNLNASFIQNIINRETQTQADNQYKEPISDTIYTKYAVLTASANPETSVNHQPVYGNCRVAVTFRILDHTTLRVEKLALNKTEAAFTVTRRLTGLRSNPVETITCSEPVVLTATLNPSRPFLKNVSWADSQSGKLITLAPSGTYQQDCAIRPNYDTAGQQNPAWIQNIIHADNERRAADPAVKLEGRGSIRETVTAVSEDRTHGTVLAECLVTVHFVTEDETTLRASGGSGGGGSSSGGSSKGVTMTGATTAAGMALPGHVVTGTWLQNAAGRWMFTDGSRTYANEWAAVHNPYANTAAGQKIFDWFRFDADGFMVTGWCWIDGKCYYFNEQSDGTRGALLCNTVTADGSRTNQEGAWVVDGVVQTKAVVP